MFQKDPNKVAFRNICFNDLDRIVNWKHPFDPNEHPRLSKVKRELFFEWAARVITRPSNRIVKIAEIGETTVGIMSLIDADDGDIELSFYVEQNYRKQGIAKVMVPRFIDTFMLPENQAKLVIPLYPENMGGRRLAEIAGIRTHLYDKKPLLGADVALVQLWGNG